MASSHRRCHSRVYIPASSGHVPEHQYILSIPRNGRRAVIETAGLNMLAVNDHKFVVHDGVIAILSDRDLIVGEKVRRCVPAGIAFGVHHYAHDHSALVRRQQRFSYGFAGEGISGDQYFPFGGCDASQDKLEGLAIRRESHFEVRVCFGVRFRPCREAQQKKQQPPPNREASCAYSPHVWRCPPAVCSCSLHD